MRRVTKRMWREFRQATEGDVDLRYDWPRRLRNALAALGEMDPGWLGWIEREIPQGLTVRETARLVERQARVLVCRQYGFTWGQWLAIVYSDTPFSEHGLLPC